MPDAARIKQLFIEALDLPAHARAAFLDRSCAGDAPMRAEIEALLAAHEAPAVLAASTVAAPPIETEGSRIGPYKLLQLIGEGGFGSVFMAEQTAPVHRRVALKIVKLGMDTRQVVARFDAERQALAMMDHPNIAKVFDAGATTSGRPYFVMELVRGSRITQYCDDNNLSPTARLELFVLVCNAVQHAHQKGVIHRDLKPSNILVTVSDGRPIPKVIDFGIAKATGARLTEMTLFTEHRQLIGTPAYMSPEQADTDSADIDTRTDIYSLGVLLYEILTGSTPFETRDLLRAGYAEIQRIIRETEPQKPSTRLSSLKDSLASVAAHRSTEPARLGAAVRGDLDWIVMKCLDKDRARRYETAHGLAADLQRHLAGEPVVAAPPGVAYRFRKFVRRNKGTVAAGGLVAAALLLGMVGTTWGMLRAQHQKNQALLARAAEEHERTLAQAAAHRTQVINDFVISTLQSSDPNARGRQDILVIDAMHQAIAGLDDGAFTDDPQTEAQLRSTISRILTGNGHPDEALPLVEKALKTLEQLHPGDDPDVLKTLGQLANVLAFLGRDAAPVNQRALDMGRRLYPGDHLQVVTALHGLGVARMTAGHLKEADELFQQALDMNRRLEQGDHNDTADILEALGTINDNLGKLKEAEAYFQQCLEMRRRLLGPEHPSTANSLTGLADVYRKLGREEEAQVMFRQVLPIYRNQFGGDHINVAIALYNLANSLDTTGQIAEADHLLTESLEMRQRLYKGDHPNVALCMSTLAAEHLYLGLVDEAVDLQQQALAMQRRLHETDHPDTLRTLNSFGRMLCRLDRYDQAEPLLHEAVSMSRRLNPEPGPWTALVLHHYADALAGLKRFEEAALPAREAVSLYQGHPEWTPHEAAHAVAVLTTVDLAMGHKDEALSAIHALLAAQSSRLTPGSAEQSLVLGPAGLSLERIGTIESAREAIPLLRQCLAIRTEAFPDGHPQRRQRYEVASSLAGGSHHRVTRLCGSRGQPASKNCTKQSLSSRAATRPFSQTPTPRRNFATTRQCD